MIRTLLLAAAAMVATAGAASAQAPQPSAYKAARDFSYQNPNGVWTYGIGRTGSTFALHPGGLVEAGGPGEVDYFNTNNALVGVNTVGKRVVENLPSSSVVQPANLLIMHTGSDGNDSIVRFTAPAAGRYSFEGYYVILDNRPTGVAPKIFIGDTDVTMRAFRTDAAVMLTGGSDPAAKKPGERRRFAITSKLKAGQIVSFGLNDAGNWLFDTTGFDVTVRPVAE